MKTWSARSAGSSGEYGTTTWGVSTSCAPTIDVSANIAIRIINALRLRPGERNVASHQCRSEASGKQQQPQTSAIAALMTLPITTPSRTLCHAFDSNGSNARALNSSTMDTVSFHSAAAFRIRHASRMTTIAASIRMAAI